MIDAQKGAVTPLQKFAFHVHKPKAEKLARQMREAARKAGYKFMIANEHRPVPNHIGIFYGVVPETYAAFQFYKAEGRAVYLDNGWLSTPEATTFRFTWNSVQPFLQDMPVAPKNSLNRFAPLPALKRQPERDTALLVMQSRQYFENLRLGYSRATWGRATTKLLEMKGYRVTVREKPNKKDPEAVTFFDQIAQAGIVVSLNSASCLKTLRYGIPSYCMLDCTLSPLAPMRLPDMGKAGAPSRPDVDDLCRRLASYEIDRRDMSEATVFDRLLSVPKPLRRGYWYSRN